MAPSGKKRDWKPRALIETKLETTIDHNPSLYAKSPELMGNRRPSGFSGVG